VLVLLATLERFYGPLPSPPTDPFRYFVWDALSAQTTPGRRDLAYAALQRLPALTPDAMFRAPRGRLQAAVALAGPYGEQRLEALLRGVQSFRRDPALAATIRGPIRRARRAVAALPRLGDGSPHRLLLFGGDHCVMPLDRDVVRLAGRLGIDPGVDRPRPGPLRHAMARELPPMADTFRRAALYLRHHAVLTCTDEPHCVVCPVSERCPGRRPAAAGDATRVS